MDEEEEEARSKSKEFHIIEHIKTVIFRGILSQFVLTVERKSFSLNPSKVKTIL